MRTSLARAACVAIALCWCLAAAAQARETRAGPVAAAGTAAVVAGNVLIILPGRVSTMDAATWRPSGGSHVEPPRRYVAADAFAPFRRAVRVRGTVMFDFYARGGSGARLTAGIRYYRSYGAADDGPAALAGPHATMRMPGGTVALRDGYERYAPVALIGYDIPLGERLTLGVEGGVMTGRAVAMFGTSWVPGEAPLSRSEGNPVADVVATYRF